MPVNFSPDAPSTVRFTPDVAGGPEAHPLSASGALHVRIQEGGGPVRDERQDMPRDALLPDVQSSEARKAVTTSSMFGVTPGFALQNLKEFDKKVDDLRMLNGLPALTDYARRSTTHARSVLDDVHNLGVLDWVFSSKSTLRPDDSDPQPTDQGPGGMYGRFASMSGLMDIGYNLKDPARAPVWLIESGRSQYSMLTTLKMTPSWMRLGGPPPDMEQIHRERAEQQNVQVGPYSPALKTLVGAQEFAQNLAPYMVHPGIAFGLMYAEGTGQTYEMLRRRGYGHGEASDLSETVGFTSAAVGTLLGGPLFGEVFPKVAMTAVGDAVPSALLRAVSDRPEFWKFVRDVGVNQFHAALMNVGMAATQSGLLRLHEWGTGRSKFSLSGLIDDVDRAAMESLKLMPLSIWSAAKGASMRAKLYAEGGPFREFNQHRTESMEVDQRIYDAYDRQGLALRSLKEAGDLQAAADAVARSKFFKESPEEGKKLIQSMLRPRKTQTVFVNPEALLGLPEQELSALNVKNLAESMTSGSMAEVRTDDFLTTPSASSLINHTEPGSGLLTPKEAAKNTDPPPPIDLIRLMAQRDHITANEPETPERRAKLDALNAEMRASAARAPLSDAQWGRLGVGSREPVEPAPQRAPEAPEKPTGPMLGFRGKLSRERLKAWADGEVEDRPIGSYDDLEKSHKRAADEAEDRAAKLQEQISADLARASGKAKKGVEHGVESGASGREGAEAALSGEATRGAVNNWVDRSLKFGERAEDQGVKAVKEEIKAGDKAKQIPKLQKIAKVNDVMSRALKDAREEADEIKDFVKGQDRNAAYRGGWEYGTAHDAITEALGGGQGGFAAPDVSDVYEKIRSDGFVATFDVKAVNELVENPKSLGELTLPQARKVKEALEQISLAAEASTKVRAEGRFQDKEVLRGKIIKYLEKIPFAPPGQSHRLDSSDALTLGQRFGKKKAELQSELNQPYTIFAKMGPVGDSLWFDGFVPAASREERLHAAHMPALQAVEESFPKEIRDTWRDKLPPPPGAGLEWGYSTRGDVVRLVLHLGTRSGIEKIAKGAGISPASLMSWAQANLARDPAHVPVVMEKFVEPTWKIFNRLWQEYEPALKERGLPPPKHLDAEPFTIQGKTYSGGYGGRLRWMDPTGGHPADPESMAALLGLDHTGPSTPQQHLQERTEYSGRPDLALSGIGASMRSEIHDLAFHGFVESTHRLLTDPEVRRTLDDKLGKQFVDQLYSPTNQTSWLHVLAQGRIPDLNSLSWTGIISNLQGRAAISAFALNARVMAMQLSHEMAMAFGMGLNPLPMARSFSSERRAWAESVSQILPYRQNDFERKNTELIRQLTGVGPTNALQEGLNQFNWMIWKALDGRLSHALWEMGLHDGLSNGKMSQEEAIRYADKVVQRGAPSQTIYEQSAFVRDRKFLGLMFLVRNFPNTLYNVQALQAWQTRAAGGNAALGALKTGAEYVGMVLAAEILGKGVLGGHLPGQGGSDEDPDAWLARNAVRSLFYPLYLDAPAEAVGHMASGNRREAARSLEHMTPAAISLASRFMLDLGDAVAGDDPKAIRAAMDALGIATKMPIPVLADWVQAGAGSQSTPEFLGRGAGYIRGDK